MMEIAKLVSKVKKWNVKKKKEEEGVINGKRKKKFYP